MRSVFSIDGVEYPNIHVTNLQRSFSILDGENAGRTLNGTMIRDVVGTYYNYKMDVAAGNSGVEEYDKLYEVISAPQDSHLVKVPYGQTEFTFQAYVTGGEDTVNMSSGVNKWDGLSISFVAMKPARKPI